MHADAMKSLTNLEVLDLRHNKFNEVPVVVYKLYNLKILYLRFNKIETVSSNIENLEVGSERDETVSVSVITSCVYAWVMVCFHLHLQSIKMHLQGDPEDRFFNLEPPAFPLLYEV